MAFRCTKNFVTLSGSNLSEVKLRRKGSYSIINFRIHMHELDEVIKILQDTKKVLTNMDKEIGQ